MSNLINTTLWEFDTKRREEFERWLGERLNIVILLESFHRDEEEEEALVDRRGGHQAKMIPEGAEISQKEVLYPDELPER